MNNYRKELRKSPVIKKGYVLMKKYSLFVGQAAYSGHHRSNKVLQSYCKRQLSPLTRVI
jgi:hypothetical protein